MIHVVKAWLVCADISPSRVVKTCSLHLHYLLTNIFRLPTVSTTSGKLFSNDNKKFALKTLSALNLSQIHLDDSFLTFSSISDG